MKKILLKIKNKRFYSMMISIFITITCISFIGSNKEKVNENNSINKNKTENEFIGKIKDSRTENEIVDNRPIDEIKKFEYNA